MTDRTAEINDIRSKPNKNGNPNANYPVRHAANEAYIEYEPEEAIIFPGQAYHKNKPARQRVQYQEFEPQQFEAVTLPRGHAPPLGHEYSPYPHQYPNTNHHQQRGNPFYGTPNHHNQQPVPQFAEPARLDPTYDLKEANSTDDLLHDKGKEPRFSNITLGNDRGCMYGCVPVNKKKRYICLAITGLILLILAIILFLFFPRYYLLIQNA